MYVFSSFLIGMLMLSNFLLVRKPMAKLQKFFQNALYMKHLFHIYGLFIRKRCKIKPYEGDSSVQHQQFVAKFIACGV